MFPRVPVNTPLPGQPVIGGGPRQSQGAWRYGSARDARRPPPAPRPQRSLPLRQRQALQAMPWGAPGRAPVRRTTRALPGHRSAARPRGRPRHARALATAAALATAPEHPRGAALSRRRSSTSTALATRRSRCSIAPSALVPGEPEFHNNRGLALAAALRDAEAIAASGARSRSSPTTRAPGTTSASPCTPRATSPAPLPRSGARCAIDAGLPAAALEPGARAAPARAIMREGWREYEWRLAAPEFAARSAPLSRSALVRRRPGRPHAAPHRRAGPGRHDAAPALRAGARRARRAVVVAVHRRRSQLCGDGAGRGSRSARRRHAARLRCAHSADVAARTCSTSRHDSIPVPVPYLRADARARRSDEVARRVARSRAAPLRSALAWSGAPGNTHNVRRAMPLAALAPLFAVADVRWFSLQARRRGAHRRRRALAAAPGRFAVRNDFDGTRGARRARSTSSSASTRASRISRARSASRCGCCCRSSPDWRWLARRAPTAPGIRRRACFRAARRRAAPGRSAPRARSSAQALARRTR